MAKVGDQVLYTPPADQHIKAGPYPAIITKVDGGLVSLSVFGMGAGATLVVSVPWPQEKPQAARRASRKAAADDWGLPE